MREIRFRIIYIHLHHSAEVRAIIWTPAPCDVTCCVVFMPGGDSLIMVHLDDSMQLYKCIKSRPLPQERG